MSTQKLIEDLTKEEALQHYYIASKQAEKLRSELEHITTQITLTDARIQQIAKQEARESKEAEASKELSSDGLGDKA